MTIKENASPTSWLFFTPMTPKQKVVFIGVIVMTGFLISLLWHFIMSAVLKLGYPWSTFLFRPEDRFMDFFNSVEMGRSGYVHPNLVVSSQPFFLLVFRLLSFLPSGLTFVLYTAVFITSFFCLLSVNLPLSVKQRGLRIFGLIGIGLCSFPFFIAIDRSHADNYTFLLIWLCVDFYLRKKKYWAAFFLGLALALKPQSFFFVALFLIDGNILPSIVSVSIMGLFNVFAMAFIPGNYMDNFRLLQQSLATYNEIYIVGSDSAIFNTSIFGALKIPIYLHPEWFNIHSPSQLTNVVSSMLAPYFWGSIIIFGAVCILLAIFKSEYWQKIAVLTCCTLLLPYSSTAMRMLYLFTPLLLFLRAENVSRLDRLYAFLFGFLLIPKSFIHFIFSPIVPVTVRGEVTEMALIDPALLLVMLTVTLVTLVRQGTFTDLAHSVIDRWKKIDNRVIRTSPPHGR
jgi:hypothetical protein